MNRILIPSIALAALLALAGCAKEFENTTDERDGAAIELSSVSTDPMTKTVITGTEFTTSEAEAGIGLFLLDGTGATYGSNSGNVRYGYSDGKWTAASPLRVGGTAGMLYGYYPYSSTVTDITAIPVASSINGTDYLYGSIADLTSANAKTGTLTLSHALARLRITFKLDASFVGDGILSSLTIEGNGVAASGALDATTGKITATKSAFTVSGLNASISTGLTEDCLVVPADAKDTPQAVTLRFTVDGKAYKVDFTDELAVKLQSGIQTDITLTVKNTSVTVDGSSIGAWGDGGSQAVTVGGNHTVTVILHKGTPASEVLVGANLDESGNAVVIKSFSEIGRKVICVLDDGNTVEPIVDGNYYKFTISDVTKDITATIRYESYKLKAFVHPSYSGTIISEYETEHQPGDNITLEVTSSGKLGNGGKFVGWKDKDGNILSDENTHTFTIESDTVLIADYSVDYGTDALDGIFTVAADNGYGKPKKVRFSKGNLYCSGATFNDDGTVLSMDNATWGFETHQYDTTPSVEGNRELKHISHFMWSKDCMRSLDKTYDGTGASTQDVFFTNSTDFAVNGISAWHTLSQPEWAYLLGDSMERNGKHKKEVTVNGVMGLVIAPDKFSGTIGNTYDATDWATAEINDGLVFLPAAGFRDGYNGNTGVDLAGSYGFYWSASSRGDFRAFVLYFDSGYVNPDHLDNRRQAFSVRLVTESN